ncbi:MAG TPA: sulfatase-like hydrolase/transferase [Balneolales bacterium]|nr:sulfatase-like hydrolase/transferase [Balneolales bacterium]
MADEHNNQISRRDFLNYALALSGGMAVSKKGIAKNPMVENIFSGKKGKKPNILFIITDEFNPEISGPYGNKLVKTPALDKMAKEGVTFNNCYTNSPLCCPSRLSFISGKYTSRTGVWGNQCWLPDEKYPSIAHELQKEGYDTVLSGKMHFDKTRRYGFTELFPGWENQHIKTGLVDRRAPDDTSVNYASWKQRAKSFHTGSRSSHIIGHDEKVTKFASDYIQKRTDEDKPFFMIAGYLAPHFPLVFPKKYYEKYKGKIGMPNIPHGELQMQPRNYQQIRRGFGFVDMKPKVEIKGRELYYSGVSWVDHQIGNLLNVLDNSKVGEDTVVIFTADHGENMGRHGMWWKNNMYDSGAKIPLIIRWPKRWKGGQRRGKVCSLLDVNLTIMDLAGAKPPGDWNGDSMVSWLDNADASWKDFAISEYYAKYTSSGFVMFRTGKYKYVYHSKPIYPYPREHQLFDMEKDPDEFVNLHYVPDYQRSIKKYHEQMVDVLGEDPDMTEIRCNRQIDKPYKRS